jgi:alanine-alpha-ketoisovalerate/valine-pyruvate aminotransferase
MPTLKMIITNNQKPVYRQPNNLNTIINLASNKLGPRLAIGGTMIERIQFAKSGCSSCGK